MKTTHVIIASLVAISINTFGNTSKSKIKIDIAKNAVSPQTSYASEILEKNIHTIKGWKVNIGISENKALPQEGFSINKKGKTIKIIGNDASGVIYGANRLIEHYKQHGDLNISNITDAPEMKIRGGCIGMQKTYYLPGHKVYEYPYTPENFPWFYDKELWINYLVVFLRQ